MSVVLNSAALLATTTLETPHPDAQRSVSAGRLWLDRPSLPSLLSVTGRPYATNGPVVFGY
jgi:hypothetical protein